MQHFSPRTRHRDLVTPKTDASHVHTNGAPILENSCAHETTECVHEKLLVFRHQLLLEQVTAEDAQPVAALFRFAAVGIENAQTKWRALRNQGAVKNSVGADAEVAMAE